MQVGSVRLGDAPIASATSWSTSRPWTEKQKLQEEKTALGFYLSGHLFDAYKDEVRRFVRQKIGELKEGRDKLIAGVIASLRTQMTQRGKMLIALLDDGTGQCEVTVFNETVRSATRHCSRKTNCWSCRARRATTRSRAASASPSKRSWISVARAAVTRKP